MGSEWQDIQLGKLITLQRGHDLPSQDRKDGVVPVMGSSGLTGFHNKHRCNGPGVVVGRSGNSMGVVSYCNEDFWPLNTALYVTDFKGNDPRYIYYLLSLIDFDQFNSGSAQKSLNRNAVYPFEVRATTNTCEQREIGLLLEAYEKKIELNRQMNTTLESMAQALFKSWFVDFDPVIDNALAAGNPIPDELAAPAERRKQLHDRKGASSSEHLTPGQPLPAAIQQQFPDRFVFTEALGWVPEGWVPSTVGEEFDVTMGQSPPGDTYNNIGEGLPFFQGRTDFGFRYPSNRMYCTAPNRRAYEGDTLVSVRAPVGDVNMAAEECCIGRGVGAVRHKSGSRSFTYYAMRQLRENFAIYEGEGTVFGSINRKDFAGLPQLKVPSDIISKFEQLAGSFDNKIEATTGSIACLISLRDTLLPKLLSGQLRIPDAEQHIAEVI